MTNQEYMLSLPADDCWDAMDWLLHEYGLWHTSPRLAVISWLMSEAVFGEWREEHGYCTPGGDPVYSCPRCGKDTHVYGIEHLDGRHAICKKCGCWNNYGYGGRMNDATGQAADSGRSA